MIAPYQPTDPNFMITASQGKIPRPTNIESPFKDGQKVAKADLELGSDLKPLPDLEGGPSTVTEQDFKTNEDGERLYTSAALVDELGIDKKFADKIIGDNKEGLTEQELFARVRENTVFDTSVKTESGEIFSTEKQFDPAKFQNYTNGSLLAKIDSLNGREDIGYEDGNLIWAENAGASTVAEETSTTSVSENISAGLDKNLQLNPENEADKKIIDAGKDKVTEVLVQRMQNGLDDPNGIIEDEKIKYEGSFDAKGLATANSQINIFSYENEDGQQQFLALDADGNIFENFKEFSQKLGIGERGSDDPSQEALLTGSDKINANNYLVSERLW